ncbi:hypothetical protein AFLA_011617 [Aspergillus flavus NRRL3357]|nr:hypothetical protein AFLA_011617 [Aspergillus flavus NRRL3357]
MFLLSSRELSISVSSFLVVLNCTSNEHSLKVYSPCATPQQRSSMLHPSLTPPAKDFLHLISFHTTVEHAKSFRS